jgi:hypothetical protein
MLDKLRDFLAAPFFAFGITFFTGFYIIASESHIKKVLADMELMNKGPK